MSEVIYDFIGIGLGPFNLSLACLTHPITTLKGLFLDRSPGFDWHRGILLQNAHLQTPFLSDLVTLADPTSPFTFLNYVKQQGRIYSFYIRENFFLMRSEYNQYCQWAAAQLDNLRFHTEVENIRYDDAQGGYVLSCRCTQTGAMRVYRARKLVLGTGTVPYVPDCCRELEGQAIHSSQYLPHKAQLQRRRSITVVGGGQSAAEIFHDLLQDIDVHGYRLSWITRSPRFFPLEYSKLTLEMTSPEYVDYFYGLPPERRDRLIASQKNLYKGINGSLINDIFDLLYNKRLVADLDVDLFTHSELLSARWDEDGQGFELEFLQREQERHYRHASAGLVLATGYGYRLPDFLQDIAGRIRRDAAGRLDVQRDYSIDREGGEIFVQNVGLHTHGFVTPDLGMVCYRNAWIVKGLTGREHYPIERKIAFQQFGAPQWQWLDRKTQEPVL